MTLNEYAAACHEASLNWWYDPVTKEPLDRNVGELLMLCVSELAEAMEGHRKQLMDDHLPRHSMFYVELVDCLIRIFDLAGSRDIDLDTIFAEKMAYNGTRIDHQFEHRMAPGGKRY